MLPLNFHRTFIPERHHIAALLEYAALGKQGTFQEISEQTGIPMGSSTGKVPAMLDYARGMGLLEVARQSGPRTKKPVLTAFGRAVYQNDRLMGEPTTQWALHIHLCRGDIGAVAWRAVFANGWRALGGAFGRDELEKYLAGIFGPGRSRTGPLARTYLEDAALGRAGVLVSSEHLIERRIAPLDQIYARVYSAVVLSMMEASFPNEAQVTVTDFLGVTLWDRVCGWSQGDFERVCALLDRGGDVVVDRQIRPWVLERRANSTDVWSHAYK